MTRGTGLVALLLLTTTVVLGVVTSSRWAPPGWTRFATAGLHRNVSLLVVVLLAVHILTAELDTFAPVGWAALVIPFASAYRPIWIGLGTVAFDLLLALVITSLARRRIGRRAWRAVHWVAYLSWPSALLHGLGAGTDPRTRWVLALTALCAVLVIAAAAWRLGQGWRQAPGRRALGAGALLAASAIVVSWTAGGPLRPGWARRAGTPTALLASSRPTTPATVPSTPIASSGHGVRPWTAELAGSLRQRGPDSTGNVTITISARLSGGRGRLTVVLEGQASDGGVSLRRSAVTLQRGALRWTGRLDALDGDQMAGTVSNGSGNRRSVAVSLQIDPSTQRVTGTITVTPAASGATP